MREIKSRSIILPNKSYVIQNEINRTVTSIVIYRIEEKKHFRVVVVDKSDEVKSMNVKNIGIKLVELENEIQLVIKENRKIIQINAVKEHDIEYYKKYINSLII